MMVSTMVAKSSNNRFGFMYRINGTLRLRVGILMIVSFHYWEIVENLDVYIYGT